MSSYDFAHVCGPSTWLTLRPAATRFFVHRPHFSLSHNKNNQTWHALAMSSRRTKRTWACSAVPRRVVLGIPAFAAHSGQRGSFCTGFRVGGLGV